MTRSLKDLEARLVWKLSKDLNSFSDDCVDLSRAQGVIFLCPKCFVDNAGSIGTHSVLCWFNGRGVSGEAEPGPGRWNPSGSGIDDLTFVGPGAVSVLLTSGCGWHGFIRNGEAVI